MHLGINFELKAYKIYNPATKKIVISRDVVFDEDERWDWNNEESSAGEKILDWGDNDKEKNPINAATREVNNNATTGEINNNAATGSLATEVNEIEKDGDIQRETEDSEDVQESVIHRNSLTSSRLRGRVSKQPTWMNDHLT